MLLTVFINPLSRFISSLPQISIIKSTGSNMKWKYKQWWTTIQPISTTRTITSHFHSLNTTKNTTYLYHVGNPIPVLGQVQHCGGVQPVNGFP